MSIKRKHAMAENSPVCKKRSYDAAFKLNLLNRTQIGVLVGSMVLTRNEFVSGESRRISLPT